MFSEQVALYINIRVDKHCTHITSSYHSCEIGIWGGNLREKDHLEMSRLRMSCVSGVHCHISLCLLLVGMFAIPGEPCYQILKMLSSPPRLPTRAADMSPLPSLPSLTFFSLTLERVISSVFSWLLSLYERRDKIHSPCSIKTCSPKLI